MGSMTNQSMGHCTRTQQPPPSVAPCHSPTPALHRATRLALRRPSERRVSGICMAVAETDEVPPFPQPSLCAALPRWCAESGAGHLPFAVQPFRIVNYFPAATVPRSRSDPAIQPLPPCAQEQYDLDMPMDAKAQKLIDAAGAGRSFTSPGWLTELGRLWGGKSVCRRLNLSGRAPFSHLGCARKPGSNSRLQLSCIGSFCPGAGSPHSHGLQR